MFFKPNKKTYRLILLLFGLSAITFAQAAETSKKIPAQLSSDSAYCTHKNNKNICIYSGNAKFDQGDTHLQGDQITINKEKNKIKKIVASGKDSRYSTTTDTKQQIDAVADIITIEPDKNTLVLEKNGKLTINQDSVEGPHIEYQLK